MDCSGEPFFTRATVARRLCLPVLLLLLLFTACGRSAAPSLSTARTLASLKQVDSYPLYVMRYYGDYDAPAGQASVEHDPAAAPFGCTTFAALGIGGDRLMGRNFDWQNHAALLLYTDPSDGFASVSMVDLSYLDFVPGDESGENKKKLLGAPRLPFDGMNERGLAVGMMAVPHAEGGSDPAKRSIGSLSAIRLMLDHAGSVEEAVDLLGRYNIAFTGGPPVHYLVCDAAGRSAVIEFVNGKLTAIPADTLWQAATNFVVAECAWNGSPSDCWRYNRVTAEMGRRGGTIDADAAMALLNSVSQPNTMWSVVYSAGAERVLVAAGRRYDDVHAFTLDELRTVE